MATSINGWPVLDNPPWGDPRAKNAEVDGIGTQLWIQRDCWPLFAAIVRDYDKGINAVHSSDGYDYRQSRTSGNWSNHASGTAVDINADAEGAAGSGPLAWWKKMQRSRRAAKIRDRYEIVYWGGATDCGGDYGPGWWDWMHWELKPGTTVADVKRVIKKLGIDENGRRAKA